jgi:hypothetical protein
MKNDNEKLKNIFIKKLETIVKKSITFVRWFEFRH